MRLLVNVRGTNASGKSTIPISMMDDLKLRVELVEGSTKDKITVFPTYKWVALGTYYSKTGGLDRFKKKEDIRRALFYALDKYPKYNVLMEGFIVSGIKSTYAALFKEVEEEYPIKVLIVSFLPPFEVCLKRLYERNGGKPISEKNVLSKYRAVERGVPYFREQGFTSIRVNNEHVSKENMLKKFLQLCEKYQEVD